jgi:hypothetical protein
MYERELSLVSDTSQRHIDSLEKENANLKLKLSDFDMKGRIDREVDIGTT